MGRHRASSREKGGSELSAQEKARRDTEDKRAAQDCPATQVLRGNRGLESTGNGGHKCRSGEKNQSERDLPPSLQLSILFCSC